MRKIVFLVMGLMVAVSANAATNNVSGGGGALQTATNNASAGDVLRVAPSTYSPISTDNKSIVIESTGGAEVAIIDGGI